MKNTFNLYYWVTHFNQCTNDETYQKISAEYDNALAKLSEKDREEAEDAFLAYTMHRMERLDKSLSILRETIEDLELMQNAVKIGVA